MTVAPSTNDPASDPISHDSTPPEYVLACMSRGKNIHGAFLQSYHSAHYDKESLSRTIFRSAGPYLGPHRNDIIRTFLDGGDEPWLVFVDDDIAFSTEDIHDLLDRAALDGVLFASGCYMSPNPQPHLVAYVIARSDHPCESGVQVAVRPDGWSYHALPAEFQFTDLDPVTQNNGLPVDAVGFGFVAIHRALLEKMRAAYSNAHPAWDSDLRRFRFIMDNHPWCYEPVIMGIHHGEDFGFCQRAQAMGHPPVLYPTTVAHVKDGIFTPDISTQISPLPPSPIPSTDSPSNPE